MAHKKIDFTKPGGFPFSQDVLKFMQEGSLDELNALARIVGDNTILFGCVVSGQEISNGWMVVEQVLLPFKGGNFTGGIGSVKIHSQSSNTALTYEDGSVRSVMNERSAQISTTGDGIPFKDFERIDTISKLSFDVVKASNDIFNLFDLFDTQDNHFTLIKQDKIDWDSEVNVLEKTLSPINVSYSKKKLKGYRLLVKKLNSKWVRFDGVLLVRRPVFSGLTSPSLPSGLNPAENTYSYKEGGSWYIDVQVSVESLEMAIEEDFAQSFEQVVVMVCSSYYPLPPETNQEGVGIGQVPGSGGGHNEKRYAHNYKTLHVPVRLSVKSLEDDKLTFRFSLLQDTVEFLNYTRHNGGFSDIYPGEVATIPIQAHFKLI